MLALFLLAAFADVSTPPKPGSDAVESAVRARLRDPDSAKFSWPHPFIRDSHDMANGGHFDGWATCGTVNSRNGFGGYSGPSAVLVYVDASGVVGAPIIDTPGTNWISKICAAKGLPVG